ncbi:bifunctional diaminohydroxyphosphoribosylaminopyrimidine deaminase/5-amino-6-(5-phosphoribosylamino)uracil reductase RibD [Lawsonella clevelandensis]|uniref:bifunctional diaminohydroxyphosphoribosylaminopyrimidine deaminase/5-amino-6-(5-phosphoribosylamino)uracil reductase RibD n=1 Tax=Lawsonella clevelandensis TaxID=1528099 RepID=UPI0026ECF04E|nr:bifunctional diaminohydroxyphosphoribosylaminopyrimidine deaminase/5-amino-6-(5-phosphoribosylamino)uracil reductase RibD [Lawsonella clevelandensis]
MTVPPHLPETVLAALGHSLTPTEALNLAIAAAESSRGCTTPNPPVGAVILDSAGYVRGIGATQPPGGPHAEIQALRMAGKHTVGGTAVVTLEPCNKWGRTGPCSHALAAAGISHLYYAVADETSFKGGAQYLSKQGIHCVQFDSARQKQVKAEGLGAWLHKQKTGHPRVTVKMASSLDGFSAAADGTSQWITGEDARSDTHLERSRVDAIIVGTGTFLADNPSLTARRADGTLYPHQPHRYVIGTRPIPGETVVSRISGMTVCQVSAGYAAAPFTHLCTRQWENVLGYFSTVDYQDVLVEGGPRLAGDLVARGYADRLLVYLAPLILGQGLSAAHSSLIDTLPNAQRFQFTSCERVGADLKLVLERNL